MRWHNMLEQGHGLFIDSGFSSELSLADSRKSRDGPIYAERSEGAYRI